MASEEAAGGRVGRFGVAGIGLAARESGFGGAVGGRVGREAVGAQLVVEVDLDGADVGGAHGSEAEEAPAPAA